MGFSDNLRAPKKETKKSAAWNWKFGVKACKNALFKNGSYGGIQYGDLRENEQIFLDCGRGELAFP